MLTSFSSVHRDLPCGGDTLVLRLNLGAEDSSEEAPAGPQAQLPPTPSGVRRGHSDPRRSCQPHGDPNFKSRDSARVGSR